MAGSIKSIRRLDFVLCILPISALAFALEHFLRGNAFSLLNHLPQNLRTLPQVAIFCLIAMFSVKVIDGRLLDIGAPHWYAYLAFAVWLLSIELPIIWTRGWPISVALFVLLLICGGLIPSKPTHVKLASADRVATDQEKASAPDKKIPTRLLVGPVGFLRSLLTIACIWLPLIWLKGSSGRGAGALIAYLGYGILYFVCLLKVLGRFADSGRSSSWYWFPFCIAVSTASMLPLRFKLINSYEALALSLLFQVPLALLRSEPRPEEPVRPQKEQTEYRKNLMQKRKAAKPFLVSPLAFLVRLLVIACLWAPLIWMETTSSNGVGAWFARCGYFILTFAWIMNATGRFADANWAFGWHTSQYCLVVSVASLMPLAVHWINGYEALAIFALIQVPTVFLESKPRLGEVGGCP